MDAVPNRSGRRAGLRPAAAAEQEGDQREQEARIGVQHEPEGVALSKQAVERRHEAAVDRLDALCQRNPAQLLEELVLPLFLRRDGGDVVQEGRSDEKT